MLGVYLLACNAVNFGQYVDDVNWLLYAEQLLKGSLLKPWHYPPAREVSLTWGVPGALMPVLALAGRNILLLKAYFALLFFSGLALFFFATRSRFEGLPGYAFLSLLFLCDFMLPFAGNIMSEPGYIFLFGLILFLLFQKDWLNRGQTRHWIFLGALSGGLALMRSIGLMAPLAVIVELTAAKKWRSATWYSAAALFCISPYLIFEKSHTSSISFYAWYWAPLAQQGLSRSLGVAWHNAFFYWKGLSCLTAVYLPSLLPHWTWVRTGAMAAAALLVSLGMAQERSALHRFLTIYGAGFFLVCCLYPYQAPRYVVPLYPVFLFFVFEGLKRVVAERFQTKAFIGLAAIALISNAPELARTLRASLSQPPEVRHAAYDWLKTHAGEKDLIVSMDMARIHYFTGRRGMLFVPGEDRASFVENCRGLNARYFVLADSGFVAATPGIEDPTQALADRLSAYVSQGPEFRLIHEDTKEGVRIYSFIQPARVISSRS